MIEVMCSNNGSTIEPRFRQSNECHLNFNQLSSDESKFNLKFRDGRVRIYSRRREPFADGCVKETDRFGGGGAMIWGGIRYRDEILVCSMGFRSGDNAGQGRVRMWLS
jgi:hypothetical protein